MPHHFLGPMLSLLSAFSAAFQYPLFKTVLTEISSYQLAMIEALLCIVFCVIISKFQKNLTWRFSPMIILCSVFNICGLLLLFEALQALNPSVLAFIARLYVIYALLISLVFFKEKPSAQDWVIALFIFSGTFIMIIKNIDIHAMNTTYLSLLFPLFFALQNASVKDISTKEHSLQILFSTKIMVFAFLAIITGIQQPKILLPLMTSSAYLSLFFGVLMGVFCSIILNYEGQKRTTFFIATAMRATTPFFTLIISAAFFPLALSLEIIAGIALIFIGLCLQIARFGKR